MPVLSGFGSFADVDDEVISDKITRRVISGEKGMLVWWRMEPGVHVTAHSHPHEQVSWVLKGSMEMRLGKETQVCVPGDVVVIPPGVEHEAWFTVECEVVDFFSPPREDFLTGEKPDYIKG
jgi:quercetin dioxygenase-like cupin family protein